MAVSLKHKFQSLKADGGDDTVVRPSNWNDEHDLTLGQDKLLGRGSSGTGPVEEITCTAAGRALIGGQDAAAQRDSLGLGEAATFGKAAAADYRTGTNDNNALTIKSAYDGVAVVTLTDATTIAVNMAAGVNFQVTLGGNRTLGNPTNAKPGQTGFIRINTNGTNRTLSYGSNWKAAGGAQAISTTNTTDYLFYQVITSSLIVYTLVKDPT